MTNLASHISHSFSKFYKYNTKCPKTIEEIFTINEPRYRRNELLRADEEMLKNIESNILSSNKVEMTEHSLVEIMPEYPGITRPLGHKIADGYCTDICCSILGNIANIQFMEAMNFINLHHEHPLKHNTERCKLFVKAVKECLKDEERYLSALRLLYRIISLDTSIGVSGEKQKFDDKDLPVNRLNLNTNDNEEFIDEAYINLENLQNTDPAPLFSSTIKNIHQVFMNDDELFYSLVSLLPKLSNIHLQRTTYIVSRMIGTRRRVMLLNNMKSFHNFIENSSDELKIPLLKRAYYCSSTTGKRTRDRILYNLGLKNCIQLV